jgi:hypothetical protein
LLLLRLRVSLYLPLLIPSHTSHAESAGLARLLPVIVFDSRNLSLIMQTSTDSKTPVSTETASQSKDLKKETRESMATIEDDDERLLAEIGYEQVRVLLPISPDPVV